MKGFRIFFALMALLSLAGSLSAQNDAISKYFNKYVEDERFTVVYISPKMFSLFDQMDLNLKDEEAQALMEVVSDLKSLRILVADENTKGFFKEAMNTINTKEYEVLLTVRNKNQENVNFYIKDNGDGIIHELLLLIGGGDEFVLMSFMGDINLSKISNLANAFEEDGDSSKQTEGEGEEQ